MPLHVAVVMDPIGSIQIAKDTSFAMLLEAPFKVPYKKKSNDGRF